VKRRHNLVNDVHSYAYTPRDPGMFSASLTLPPAQAARALEETARVLATLRMKPVDADELATAKALVEAEAVYQRETVQGIARKMGSYQSGMGSLEAEARYYEAVRGLTPEHLRDAAERYLRFDRAIVTGLLPAGSTLTEAQVHEVLDKVAKEPAAAPPERKPRKVPAGEPSMRIAKAAGGPSDIITEKLPSGATVVVRVEPAVPLVAMRAAFPGGLRYETPADNGISTLLTRCLNRGTPSHDAEDIAQLVDAYAGSLGARAGATRCPCAASSSRATSSRPSASSRTASSTPPSRRPRWRASARCCSRTSSPARTSRPAWPLICSAGRCTAATRTACRPSATRPRWSGSTRKRCAPGTRPTWTRRS
jgi:zinc protease